MILTAALVSGLAAACEERRSPTAPDIGPAAITIENVTTTAGEPGFTYRMSLTLREKSGVGATISDVTVTLTETSSAATVAHLSPVEAFGTTRITPNGTLTSTGIALAGPLLTVQEMTVGVTFIDENRHNGSAQTSTSVKLDLTGEWSGALGIPTLPAADWSLGRATLVQNGDTLTGELVSRDGVRFSLTGGITRLSIGGLKPSRPEQLICAINLLITELEFESGRAGRLSGRALGRCPGTVANNFELQRSS